MIYDKKQLLLMKRGIYPTGVPTLPHIHTPREDDKSKMKGQHMGIS
jgi:hypothetical protein